MIRTLKRKTALALPLAAMALAVSSAYAASVGPSGPAFYNPPASLDGNHGDLISYRPATVKLGTGAPGVNAWNVMYLTQDSDEENQPVTGTVFVPTAAWTGGGARPVILYAMGTHGLGSDCAASKQLEQGTDYEIANLNAALKAGYAVLVTDYVGYTTGGLVRYMAGESQGRNVLDIYKAALSIPNSGIDASAKVAIWGYSQGGQASSFAAELLPTYTPDLAAKTVGVATGGIPGDLATTARYLNASNGSAFLFSAIAGLYAEYPANIPFQLAATDAGKAEFENLKTQCIFKALFTYANNAGGNQPLEKYTKPDYTLENMLTNLKQVKDVMSWQVLGNRKINMPVYMYHGAADEFIPLGQAFDLKQRYCGKGTDVQFDLYPSEHITTQFQAAPMALSWISDRLAGKPTQSTCSNTTPPTFTGNDNKGDLKVNLDKWKLKANVHLRTLMQDVVMPDSSTFSGVADVNRNVQSLTGSIAIPDFTAPIKLIGIPFPTGLRIQPVSDVSGTSALDDGGTLHVHGKVNVDITVRALLGIPIGLCKSVTPVPFGLDFDGPISALGAGGLTFAGSTAFPQMKGCIISGILTLLMTGQGQTYSFTVAPPAPVAN